MSERPTPETDAEYKEANDYEPSAFVEPLAKFLAVERERDEAREAFIEARKHREQLNSLLQSYEACWDEIKTTLGEPEEGDQTCDLDRVLKAIRERDEAREKAERYRLEVNAMMLQRDEARAERDILRSNKMSDPLLETTFKHLNRERDEACQVANGLAKQAERLRKERDQLKEALLIMENLLKPGIELFPEIGEILKQGGAK